MVGNKAQKAVAAALTGMLALGSVAPALAGTQLNNGWWRIDGTYKDTYNALVRSGQAISGSKDIDGQDRYDTMLDAIATNVADGYWDDVKEVVLVSGTSFADSLSATGLAGVLNEYQGAPLITTPAESLGIQAERAIQYFADQLGKDETLTVYIVGGESAVSADVKSDVEDIEGVKKAEVEAYRIQGADRVATSLKVAEFIENYGDGWKNTNKKGIFVANGWAWADALSVSSFAYANQTPILLANSDGTLSAGELEFIEDNDVQVSVVGGPAKLSYDSLKDEYEAGKVEWIWGADRYETSAKVVENDSWYAGKIGGGIAVATGTKFADALVGGAFIGERAEGMLVLVGDAAKDENFDAALIKAREAKSGTTVEKYIIGGEAAIDKDTAFLIRKI